MNILDRLRAIVAPLPTGAAVTLPADALREWLDAYDVEPAAEQPATPACADPDTWRTRLWTCPPDTRLGVREVAEALDRSPDFVYRCVSQKRSAEKGRDPLPCSRFDGELVFVAADVRRWLQASEAVVNPARRPRAA
jgi:hypothetical protein